MESAYCTVSHPHKSLREWTCDSIVHCLLAAHVHCPFIFLQYSFYCALYRVWRLLFVCRWIASATQSAVYLFPMCQLDHLIWIYVQRNYRDSNLSVRLFSSIKKHWVKRRSRVQSKRLQLYSRKSYCSDVRRPKKWPMTVSKARSFICPSLL